MSTEEVTAAAMAIVHKAPAVMAKITNEIAEIIYPEAFDRQKFRTIVKANNNGHTSGFDIKASMNQAQFEAKARALEIIEIVYNKIKSLKDGENNVK